MAVNLCAKFFFLATFLISFQLAQADEDGLRVGFYKYSCPDAETIIHKTVESYFSDDQTVSAPVLRLHFHDCFVRGCDGSLLLNSTKKNLAEKDSRPDQTLDGFFVIDAAKAALEKACPGIVSCADIVAIAARDAVSLAIALGRARKGSKITYKRIYQVETGRRDGVVSKASEALAFLPSPFSSFSELKGNFSSKGLNLKDLVVLSGAHAIGNSHCFSFEERLYNYSTKYNVDPTLDQKYAIKLRKECKTGIGTVVEMVPGSSTTFDTKYYKLVAENKGLFHSDAVLFQNKKTRGYIYSRIHLPESVFFEDFGKSMIKMGRVGVLTGTEGQIRKNCALVNL